MQDLVLFGQTSFYYTGIYAWIIKIFELYGNSHEAISFV